HAERPLLEAPVRPHRAAIDVAVAALDVDLRREVEHVPEVPDPRTGGHHDLLAGDRALSRPPRDEGSPVAAEPGDPDGRVQLDAEALALGAEPSHRGHVLRVPAPL